MMSQVSHLLAILKKKVILALCFFYVPFCSDTITGTDRDHLFISYGDFTAINLYYTFLQIPTDVTDMFGVISSSVTSWIASLTPFHVLLINIGFAATIGVLYCRIGTKLKRRSRPCRFVANRRHTTVPSRSLRCQYRFVLLAVMLCGHEASTCVNQIRFAPHRDTLNMTTSEEKNFVYDKEHTLSYSSASQRVSYGSLQKGTCYLLPCTVSSLRCGMQILLSNFDTWATSIAQGPGVIYDNFIYSDIFEASDDTEALSLMARSAMRTRYDATHSSDGLERARVYRKNFVAELVTLPPRANKQYYRSIFAFAPELRIPSFFQEHFLIYSILPPPRHDYEALFDAFILAVPPDIIPGCSLILLHQNPRPPAIDHNPANECRVLAVPYCCDRDRFIMALGLHDLCGGPSRAHRCRITVGGVPWEAMDLQWRYIFDGTFVEVVVSSTRCDAISSRQAQLAGPAGDTSIDDFSSFMQTGPLLHFQGVLYLSFRYDDGYDLLRTYLQTRYPELQGRRLVPIHGWHVHFPGELFSLGHHSHPFQEQYSWTNCLLTSYYAYRDAETIVVADIRPLPPPLTLRANSITLLSIPARSYDDGYTAYMIDCHIDRSVQRKAVVVRGDATFRDICIALQLGYLLSDPQRFIKLYYRLDDQSNIYSIGDVVALPFASFMTLFSYPFETCLEHDLTVIEPEDAASFMQRIRGNCQHLPYLDDQIWRRAHPNENTVLISVWYHPWLYTEYFLQNERFLTLARQECLRCRVQILWSDHVGRRPITLIPLRTRNGIPPPRNALAVLTVDDPQYRLCFIEYRYDNLWRFGTLLFSYPDIHVPLALLFDRAGPQHECRFGAICRGLLDDLDIPYPGFLPVYEGAWIRLFEELHHEDDLSQSTWVPQNTATEASSCADTTSSEYDGSDLLQVTMSLFQLSPIAGLPPPGNPDLHTLDDIIWVDDIPKIVDVRPRSIPTPCRTYKCLPNITDDWPDVILPDLSSLIDKLFLPLCPRPLDWNLILSILPDDLRFTCADLILDPPTAIPSIHIYTDGSFSTKDSHKKAAWAFAVLTFCGGETYLLDYGYGLVETNELDPGWTGSQSQGPREAEFDGIIRALEWALRKATPIPTTIHYDSTVAGCVASGSFKVNPKDLQACLLRNLALALNTFAGKDYPILWDHVPAHQGHFGNELADAIAKYTFQEQVCCDTYQHIDYMPYIVGERPQINWLWYYFRSFDQQNDLPTGQPTTISVPSLSQPLSLEQILPSRITSKPQAADQFIEKKFHISFLQFNTNTLNETDGKRRTRTVPVFLREQLVAHQAHFTFLQETRASKSCVIESSTHVRLISASQTGHGGTEIWCQRYIGTHGKVALQSKDVLVLFAHPEILIIKCNYVGIKLICVSAHAPHTGRPKADHDTFWHLLTDTLRGFETTDHALIVGIDANSHFECESPPYIGPHGLEEKANYAADKFLQFLVDFQLFLPSTFEHAHEGETWTWQSHTHGGQARCDYVAIPLAWSSFSIRSYSVHTFDIGAKSIDHNPIGLDVSVHYQKLKAAPAADISFDRRRFQQITIPDLRHLFDDLPNIPWDCSVDEHATRLSTSISTQLVTAFPVPKHGPRKSFITAATWSIRGERIRAIRQLRSTKQKLNSLTLSAAYWALNDFWYFSTADFTTEAFQLLGRCMYYGRQIRTLAGQLHSALRADKVAYITQIADQAETLPGKFLHQQLRQLGVNGRAKQRGFRPLLTGADGQTLQTLDDIAKRWHSYFEEQEDGYRTNLEELLQEHTTYCHARPITPNWYELPTLQEVENQFRSTQCNRAYYDDGVPGDLLHYLPDVLARAYYPLYLKISLLQREPLIFKGGILTPAYKGKGSPSECTSYRSLLVSSPFGKAWHALLRRSAIHHFYKVAQPFQIGGLPGKSITQATQSLLAYQWASKERNLSVGLIFIDVQNAFYRVLRQHITDTPDPRGVQQLFTNLGLPSETFAEFEGLLREEPALLQSDLPPLLHRLLSEALRGTWFTVANSTSFSRTRRGTRPGDSLADICFTFALAKILGRAFQHLHLDDNAVFYWDGEPHPPPSTSQNQAIDILCPIWADDIAIALAHRDPEILVSNLRLVARHVFEALAKAGMAPNFKIGKTEVILDLRGHGARQQLRCLMATDMTLDLQSSILPPLVRVVNKYQHLGTWLTTGIKMVYDMKSKFAIAHQAITKYRSAIFANRALSLKRKTQLFRSLIASGITFSIGAWHILRPVEYRFFVNGFYRLYRRLSIMHFGPDALKWSHEQLCYELGVETPITLLAIGRLRYVQQLIREGQSQLWGLLQQGATWWTCLFDHFDWLQTRVPYLLCPHPRDDWHGFYTFLQTPGNVWKGILKKAQSFEILYQSLYYQWNRWHRDILICYASSNAIPNISTMMMTGLHFCLKCRQCFSRAAAWSVHSFKKHGRVTEARHYAEGTQCSACLRHYSIYPALVNHLKYSADCLNQLRAQGPPVIPQPGLNSRTEIAQRQAQHLPYVQAEGPRKAIDASILRPTCDETTALHEAWTLAWAQHMHESTEQKVAALRDATRQMCLPRAEILTALDAWLGKLPEDLCTLDIFHAA